MKNYVALLFTLFTINAFSQVQISIPETPKKVEFADVVINLDDDTRKEVEKEVNALLTPQNSFLDAKLERMQWYFPIIERILDEEDVPDDLKYISVMESSLIPEALSTSSAVGFWQFKKATGEELGLRIDNDIDERRYIHASTKAAALYFKRNNLIFKNWISSIYSYNQGPTGAASAIPEEWSYASEVNFTKDTPQYLIRALAHRIAFEHRLNRLRNSPRIFIEYPTKDKSLAEIAAELTVDISELRKFNSWLSAASIPSNKEYVVLIPVRAEDADGIRDRINKRRDLVKVDVGFPQLQRTSAATVGPDEAVLYNVNDKKGILAQPGDEVAQLAKKGNLKIFNFLKINDMTDRDMVKTGQVYYLQKKGKKAKVPFHTVMGEQTLWEISQMYGVELKRLLKYNRLTSVQRLQPGRVIWLQKKRPKNQPVEIIREAIPTPSPEKVNEALPVVESYTPEPKKESVVIIEEEDEPFTTEPEAPLIEAKKEEPKKVVVIASENDRVISNTPKDTYTEIKRETPTSTPKNTSSSSAQTHRVARGETLYSISKRYGLSVNELRSINGMSTSDVLQYDQLLKVNSTNPDYDEPRIVNTNIPTKPDKTNTVETVKTSTSTHTVAKGETLFSISKKYDLSVAQLKSLNGLNDNTISIGQRLTVGQSTTSRPVVSAGTHVVRAGETLYSISKKYNASVEEIKAWNNLNSNEISIGQVLEIR